MKKKFKNQGTVLLLIVTLCTTLMFLSSCQSGEDADSADNASKASVDVASYDMDLTLDTNQKTLSGEITMNLVNNSSDSLDEICIRNYSAAFFDDPAASKIASATSEDGQALSLNVQKDPTVVYVSLGDKKPKEGESFSIKINYSTKIPENKGDRFGFYEDGEDQLYLLSFCFPHLAMYQNGSWDENPYIEEGETTFTKVTDYNVKLHTPEGYTVAASGDEETAGGETTIIAKDMRDMAIVACNYMDVETETIEGVEINNYTLQYDNSEKYNQTSMDAAKDSVKIFTERFGAYPYKELDVVQCFLGGGMEYPGLVMIGLWDLAPEDYLHGIDENSSFVYVCSLIAHEIGHQWFYASVGNDQYEEPWLDEGFAEFCSFIYEDQAPSSLKDAIAIDADLGGDEGSIFIPDRGYMEALSSSLDSDEKVAINLPFSSYSEEWDYDTQVYQNGSLFLYELMTTMGEDTFFDCMQEYYKTYCLKEATGEDFLKMVRKYDDSDEVQKIIDKYIED